MTLGVKRARGSPQWHWAKPGGREPEVWAGLEPAEAEVLAQLAQDQTVLEIGSAFGFSTIVMAQVAKVVVAVDPHTQFDSEAKFNANLIAHGVRDKVADWTGTSAWVLPRLAGWGRSFGLVFIDGDHLPPSVRFDLFWARQLVKPGGSIALHDYLLGPGTFVRPVCQEWREPDRLVETLGIYVNVQPAADGREPPDLRTLAL